MTREQIVDRLARRGVWLDERYLEIVESVIREAEAAARAEQADALDYAERGLAEWRSLALAAQPATVPEGFVLVPVEPTEEMWSGLARDLIMWLDFERKTPGNLFRHLEMLGREIPDWLREEGEMQSPDHVPSKGTRAVLIYRAMLADAPKPEQQECQHEWHEVVNDVVHGGVYVCPKCKQYAPKPEQRLVVGSTGKPGHYFAAMSDGSDLPDEPITAVAATKPEQKGVTTERECRHCGFLCRPNPAESRKWHPLEQEAPELTDDELDALEGQAVADRDAQGWGWFNRKVYARLVIAADRAKRLSTGCGGAK